MSETPRTDENRFHSDIGGWVCYSSLCRQLERELNEASERIKRMEKLGDTLANCTSDNPYNARYAEQWWDLRGIKHE